jgi:hypothetical protein
MNKNSTCTFFAQNPIKIIDYKLDLAKTTERGLKIKKDSYNYIFKIMQELEDAPTTLRIARLVEMIMMDNEIISTHKEHNSPSILVTQYIKLRNEHLHELQELMAICGVEAELKIAA